MLKCCKKWLMALWLGILIAAFPIRFDITAKTDLTVGFPFAYAKGSDDGGGGSDNSGPGNGRDGGLDNSGRGNGGDDGDDDNSGPGNNSYDGRISSDDNVEIEYANGWQEWIRNGRYRLTDPKGRTVSNRWARPDDLARLRRLLDQ